MIFASLLKFSFDFFDYHKNTHKILSHTKVFSDDSPRFSDPRLLEVVAVFVFLIGK